MTHVYTTIFTIGHSNRTIEVFIDLLKQHEINFVIDVRSIPKSKHNPQFNERDLFHSLDEVNILYMHDLNLGGLRRPKPDSINNAWKNASFRGFADYMQTDSFKSALESIISLTHNNIAAVMCAEAVPWRCHRWLISDALCARGVWVEHIMNSSATRRHELTAFARISRMEITYPA